MDGERTGDVLVTLPKDNSDDVIVHYGVKGMKWGVRKDRSSGGTGKRKKKKTGLLGRIQKTYQAKERAAKAEAELQRMQKAKPGTVFTRNAGKTTGLVRTNDGSAILRSRYSGMDDDTLRATVQRLSLEKQYKQLTSETKNGKQKFNDTLKKVSVGAAKASAIIGVLGGAAALGAKYGLNEQQTKNLENTLKILEILGK